MKAAALLQALTAPGSLLRAAYESSMIAAEDRRAREADFRMLAAKLPGAHKFEAPYGGLLDDDGLQQTAVEFFRAGSLCMPFKETYFEFHNCFPSDPANRLGVFVVETAPSRISAYPFMWRKRDGWLDLGTVIKTDYTAAIPEKLEVIGDKRAYGDWWQTMQENSQRAIQYVNAVTLFMSTKQALTRDVPGATDDANRKRASKGKQPIFEYHVVTIKPEVIASADLGGTHASPRLHWRRGHLRSLPSGARTTVKPHLVGLIDRGFVAKDYVVAPAEKESDE